MTTGLVGVALLDASFMSAQASPVLRGARDSGPSDPLQQTDSIRPSRVEA